MNIKVMYQNGDTHEQKLGQDFFKTSFDNEGKLKSMGAKAIEFACLHGNKPFKITITNGDTLVLDKILHHNSPFNKTSHIQAQEYKANISKEEVKQLKKELKGKKLQRLAIY
jgi:hypothetical protein